MSYSTVSIHFNDSPSQFNRDLTRFLKRNLDKIVRRGRILIDFNIATPKNLKNLRDSGVTRLPAMQTGVNGPAKSRRVHTGVPTIIEVLQRMIETSKFATPMKQPSELLMDFQLAEAIAGEDNPIDNDGGKRGHEILREMERERQLDGPRDDGAPKTQHRPPPPVRGYADIPEPNRGGGGGGGGPRPNNIMTNNLARMGDADQDDQILNAMAANRNDVSDY